MGLFIPPQASYLARSAFHWGAVALSLSLVMTLYLKGTLKEQEAVEVYSALRVSATSPD